MRDDLSQLSFMAGAWKAQRGESTIDELWLSPSGGTMMGVSRSVRSGKTTFEEHLRIDLHDGKARLMILREFGTAPITLVAGSVSDREVRFDPVDDPNRATITYSRTEAGLTAVIEGIGDSGPYRLVFEFVPAQ